MRKKVLDNKIQELTSIISNLDSIYDKEDKIVITSDNRIITVKSSIAENDYLFINGFTDLESIESQATRLQDRIISLEITCQNYNHITAYNLNLATKNKITDYYYNQGISLSDILAAKHSFENDINMLVATLESILTAKKANCVTSVQDVNYSSLIPVKKSDTHPQRQACRVEQSLVASKNNLALFFKIVIKQQNIYHLRYFFDMISADLLTLELGNTKKFWIDKLAFIFIKAIGIYNDSHKNYVPETILNQEFIYYTKANLKKDIEKITKTLKQENLYQFSNIDTIFTNYLDDISSKNYEVFRSLRKILKHQKNSKESYQGHKFKYNKILSLADGCDAGDKTSNYIATNLTTKVDYIEITAADLQIKSKINKKHDLYDNVFIKNIKLNNNKNFQKQGLIDKFNLIAMHRGLCYCNGGLPKTPSCGGIVLNQPNGLKSILSRVASVIDNTDSSAIAILTGKNIREYSFWIDEIANFNLENNANLVAEIARNKTGIFKGILINTK